jgi:hypothetical protein
VIGRREWAANGLAGAALLLLGGCSSANTGDTDYSQFFQLLKQNMSASFGNVHVTREQAAAIPFATLGYSIDGGNQSILVLATDTAGELLWTSQSHVVIVTRDGRIVRTLGLGHDLSGLTTRDASIPSPATAVLGAFASTRLEDFPDIGAYGAIVSCRATLVGRQGINVLGQMIATNRVDERCRSPNPKWSFVDTYWVDLDSGLVWRSQQHIHPKGGVIETVIFRPPG